MNLFRQTLILSALLASLALAPAAQAAETLYTKTDDTKVMASESAESSVVATLPKNTAVEVAQKSAKFYKVRVPGGGEGWIFKFKLGAAAESSGGGNALGALGGKQRFAANEAGSGSSIRGLSPVSERHAREKGIAQAHIDAVKSMEQFRVEPKELDDFQRQGRIGEYSP